MTLRCRTATPFTTSGRIDEDALRASLHRLVDAGIGVYLASSPFEGFTFTPDEISVIYRVAVQECKGRVFVGANGMEQHTAEQTIAISRLGVDAGVDAINIYGPPGWHGFRPNEAEYLRYFERVFEEIDYSVALAPNHALGYSPTAATVAELCNRYPQITAVNFAGQPDDIFFINVLERLEREIETYVPVTGSMNYFALGATGLLGVEANFIPQTFRLYMDHCEAGRTREAGAVYADIKRFIQFVGASNPQWGLRWVKVAMAAFRLPGWSGGIREPYVMPDADEISRFAAGALALGIPEIDAMGRAAGLL
jgi:dihydrodipicolinate synthase/N-acetylneuraminate lyase